MKVILLKDVKGVGRIHDVKDVADGYAINNLMPRKLAEVATPEKIARIEATRAQHEKEAAAHEAELAAHVRSLNNARFELTVRATPKGGLFKAIGSPEIIRAIKAEKGIDLPESAIDLDHPIKTTGEHTVPLHVQNIKSTITVAVIAQ
ncbi:MAG TPA: 50S ribosomal protein L9 [Candidatus Paceibacterota bacterium]